MSYQNSLELAKQGHPDAIAELINRNLQPKGITAKISRKKQCLKVILESNKVLNQESLVEFVYRGILKLEIHEIDTLQISGKQANTKTSAWTQTINLKSAQSEGLESKDLVPQKLKNKSGRQVASVDKVAKQKGSTNYFKLIILSIFTMGFLGWLLTTEEYQTTLEETAAPKEETAAPKREVDNSVEYNLAAIQQGKRISQDDPLIARFEQALDRLESKCPEPRQSLAEMGVRGHELLIKEGIKEPLVSTFENWRGSIPDDMTKGEVGPCADILAAYVSLRDVAQ